MHGLSRLALIALIATLGCDTQPAGKPNTPSAPIASAPSNSAEPAPVFTETPADPGKPVTPAIALTRTPGDSVAHIWIRLSIASGYHVYGKIERKSSYQPLTVELNLPEGTTTTGDWEYPAAEKSNGHPAYFDSVVIKQALKLGPEKGPLTAAVRYQACNDEVCFPPTTAELKVSLD